MWTRPHKNETMQTPKTESYEWVFRLSAAEKAETLICIVTLFRNRVGLKLPFIFIIFTSIVFYVNLLNVQAARIFSVCCF